MKNNYASKIIIIALFLAIFLGISLYKIEQFPPHDYDESSLLLLPFRAINFSDTLYPVFLSKRFNSDENRKYPPPLALLPRVIFHKITTLSDTKSRIYSAVLVALSLAGAAGFLALGSQITVASLSIYLLMAGFWPAIILNSRTVRFEHSIIFFGFMGLILTVLSARATLKKYIKTILFFIAGLFTGWCACSHIWGAVFPAVQLFYVLLLWGWNKADHKQTPPIFFAALISGIALPVLVYIYYIISDLNSFENFFKAMKEYYALRGKQNFAALGLNQTFFSEFFPREIAAKLALLKKYPIVLWSEWGKIPSLFKNFEGGFIVSFFVQISFVVICSPFLLFNSFRKKYDLDVMVFSLFFALLVVFFVYPGSTNYALYFNFIVPLAFFLASYRLLIILWNKSFKPFRVLTAVPIVILFSTIALNLLFISVLPAHLSNAAQHKNSFSLDTKLNAIKALGRKIYGENPDSEIYMDHMTWIAAGKNMQSLLEAVSLSPDFKPGKISGVVFQSSLLETILKKPTMASFQLSKEQKLQRLDNLITKLTLRGVLISFDHRWYFYAPPPSKPSPIMAGIIRGEKDVLWGELHPIGSWQSIFDVSASKSLNISSKGDYFLLLQGAVLANKELSIFSKTPSGHHQKIATHYTIELGNLTKDACLFSLDKAGEIELEFNPKILGKNENYKLRIFKFMPSKN